MANARNAPARFLETQVHPLSQGLLGVIPTSIQALLLTLKKR